MGVFTRNLPADVTNPTTVDNNPKAEAGAGPPMVQVAPEGDLFGDAVDGHWIENIAGSDLITGYLGLTNSTGSEVGGKYIFDDGGSTAVWMCAIRRSISYKDADIPIVFDDAKSGNNASKTVYNWCMLWKSKDNAVMIQAQAVGAAGSKEVRVYKVINGASTTLHTSGDIGVQSHIKLRIKRVASTNTFTFYYDIGGGWVTLWGPGVITDATHFPFDCDLYPVIMAQGSANYSWEPETDSYAQKTDDGIAAQRFWPDSPEADIKDSVNCGGGESYAFDAAVNKTWVLTGASSVEDGDGGTVGWKVGFSDAADGSGITWDATWQTIAQVNTNAAAGNYDGHRYLYVKWQGNSDSTQKPNATSFTISGSTSASGTSKAVLMAMSRMVP